MGSCFKCVSENMLANHLPENIYQKTKIISSRRTNTLIQLLISSTPSSGSRLQPCFWFHEHHFQAHISSSLCASVLNLLWFHKWTHSFPARVPAVPKEILLWENVAILPCLQCIPDSTDKSNLQHSFFP